MHLKSFFGGLKTNLIGGRKIAKKVVIFESDDWGAIRTPSLEALRAFSERGFELEKSYYKADALASRSDLEDLFDLLLSHHNSRGKSPVITANAIMANPDFEKIKASDFQEYFFEPFTTTFKNYPEHEDNLALWKYGQEQGIFIPEYHGREHLNIRRWLMALQSRDENVRFSFDYKCTYSGRQDYAFMEAFDWDNRDQVDVHRKILQEGAQIFQATFAREPRSFIAPCYNWDSQLEADISRLGVKWIQGLPVQLSPTGQFNRYHPIRHYFAESNGATSRYNIRNVFFEPFYNVNTDWTDRAMARISAAFLSRKPAVISTHRINYVGFIDPRNKANGLKHLNCLLKAILKKWPDVHFITTSQLTDFVKMS